MGFKHVRKNRGLIRRRPFSGPPARLAVRLALLAILTLHFISCGGRSDSSQQQGGQPGNAYHPYELLCGPASTGPLVAAHRGAHNSFPENSLAAIREAARLGADFAEIDVRSTQDGVLVLMHDSNLHRTTGFSAEVSATTYAQISELTLPDGDLSNPETLKVPTFAEALALARETGIMLYVDVKTDRDDLVVAGVRAGPYYDAALLRSSLGQALRMRALDANLLIMPIAQTIDDLNAILAAMPGIRIVELNKDSPDAEFCTAARNAGVKAQQDVIGWPDVAAVLGNYGEWAKFAYAGVWLLQTDQPELLIPAARTYRQTGMFP